MTIKLTPKQEAEAKRIDEAWQQVSKLSGYAVIESVEERHEHHNHRRIDPNKPATGDNVAFDIRSIGWFIRVGGSSAVHVGMKQPPAAFKRGARIKHSIELAPEPSLPTPYGEAVVSPSPQPTSPGAAVAQAVEKAGGGSDFVHTANAKAREFRRDEV